MSSESNGHKPDSLAAGPPSGVAGRTSARAPSAWGAVRDAIAAVHNLEALLRRASVESGVILDLMAELHTSAGVLRAAFERSLAAEEAVAKVGEHGRQTVDRLDELLEAIAAAPDDRAVHADKADRLADELEAAADLLALLDRAVAPVSTEVSLDLVAREAGRMSGTARGREMIVQFDEAIPDCLVTTDPYLLGPVLSFLVARIHAAGTHAIVLRARSSPRPHFLVERAELTDAALPTLSLRVTLWFAGAEGAVRRLAEQIGATLELEEHRGSIALPV
jgi:pyruvate/2-oxoglutarate dehydrogenase complex dihydrolipoamide acyltransferase (E2) component